MFVIPLYALIMFVIALMWLNFVRDSVWVYCYKFVQIVSLSLNRYQFSSLIVQLDLSDLISRFNISFLCVNHAHYLSRYVNPARYGVNVIKLCSWLNLSLLIEICANSEFIAESLLVCFINCWILCINHACETICESVNNIEFYW